MGRGFKRREDRVEESFDADTARSDGFHKGNAQGFREYLRVDAQAFCLGLIGHVEGAHDGDPQFLELEAEVEVPLEIC